jgi:hypothetical protein
MRAQEAFDEMVRGTIWPVLRSRGFKRSGNTFHRAAGRNWQVINFQKSVGSSGEEVRFTANIAVALDRLRGGLHDWAEGKRPSESRCHLRERIGLLLGSSDTWWSVTPDTNVPALGDAVCTALETYALPWLDGHADDERLLELMRDPVALAQERYDMLHWLAELATREHEDEVAAEIRALQDRKFSRARSERQRGESPC